MRRRARPQIAYALTAATVCFIGTGCGVVDLSCLSAGFPFPGIGAENVLVVIQNESGARVRVDADFTFSSDDVRRTSRVLDPEGANATASILRTLAERIDVVAVVESTPPEGVDVSPLLNTGLTLLDVTYILNQDYLAGDTLIIVISGPGDDCDENGVPDDVQIELGGDDCDMNGIPDACQPDVDGDGVIDGCDNCLSIENPDQKDDDNNGLGDACETGACEYSVDCIETTLSLCNDMAGSFQGVGTECPSVGNPVPTGACCLANGECTVVTQASCTSSDGTYQGDDTNCESAECPDPVGACCTFNGCIETTALSCNLNKGDYFGDGSICEEGSCVEPTGACCFGINDCSVLTANECDSFEGDYEGDGVPCEFASCTVPTGACCGGESVCTVITESDCSALDGSYNGDDSSCEPNPCIPNEGACCLMKGQTAFCEILDEGSCNKSSGTYLGDGSTCDGTPCEPTGACCYEFSEAETSCVETTEESCGQIEPSLYLGDGTTCDDNPCNPPAGACCYYDGFEAGCLLVSENACDLLFGAEFLGAGIDCADDPCGAISGACCLSGESCIEMTESSCIFEDGTFEGVGVSCDGACQPQTGACCYGETCIDAITQANCEVEDGAYQGDGSNCDSQPCIETGACCLFDSCIDVTEAECFMMEGSALPPGTSCSTIDCNSPIFVEVSSNRDWVYENLPMMRGGVMLLSDCEVNITADVTTDPLSNASYSYYWRQYSPFDRPDGYFTIVNSNGENDLIYRSPDRPGFSPGGASYYFEVTVIGNEFGNYGIGYVELAVRLLGDVNDSGCTDAIDIGLINSVIDGSVTDDSIIDAADVNCDGFVDAFDGQTALLVLENTDGAGSCVGDDM